MEFVVFAPNEIPVVASSELVKDRMVSPHLHYFYLPIYFHALELLSANIFS